MSDLDCCYPFVYGRESLCGNGPGAIPPDSDVEWQDANSRGYVGKDGDLWIWRGLGQKPTRIPGEWRKVSQVSVPARLGGYTASVTLAIKSDGSLWGWAGKRGDLGLVDYPEECYAELSAIGLRAKIRSSVEGFFIFRGDSIGTPNGEDSIFGFSDSPLSDSALSSTLLQIKQEKDGQIDDTFDGVEATARPEFLYDIIPYGDSSGLCSFAIEDGGAGYTSSPTVEIVLRGDSGGRFYQQTPSAFRGLQIYRAIVEGGSVVRVEGGYRNMFWYTGDLDVVISGGDPKRAAAVSMRNYSSHMLLPKLIDGGSGYTLSSSRTIGAYYTFPPGTRFGQDRVKIFGATIKEAGISSFELTNSPTLTGSEPTRITTGAISGETIETPDVVDDVYYIFGDGSVAGADKGPLYTLPNGYPANKWTLTSRTSGHSTRPLIVKKMVNNGYSGEMLSGPLYVYVFGDRVTGVWSGPWDGVTRPTLSDAYDVGAGYNPPSRYFEWREFAQIGTLNYAFGKVDSSLYSSAISYDVGWQYGNVGGGPLSGTPVPDRLWQPQGNGGNPFLAITYKTPVGPPTFTNSVNWVDFIDGPKVDHPSADFFFSARCASPAHGRIVYNDKGYPVSVTLLDHGSGFRSEPESPVVTMDVLEPTLLSDEADFVDLSSSGLLLDSSGNGYRHEGPLGVIKVQPKKQVNIVDPKEYMLGNTVLTFSRPTGKSLAAELTSIQSLYDRPFFWSQIPAGPLSRMPSLFASGFDGMIYPFWATPYFNFGDGYPFSVGLNSSGELRRLIEPDLPPLPVPSAAVGYVPSELGVTSLPAGCSLSDPSFTSLSRIDGDSFVSSDGKRIRRDGRRAEEEPYIETGTQRPLSVEDVSNMRIPVSGRSVIASAEFTFSVESYEVETRFLEFDANDQSTFLPFQIRKREIFAPAIAKRFKCSDVRASTSVSESDARQVLASGSTLILGQTTVAHGEGWRPLDSESYKWTLGTPVLSRSSDATNVESWEDEIPELIKEENWLCTAGRSGFSAPPWIDSDGNDINESWLEEFGYAVEDAPGGRFSVFVPGEYGTKKYTNASGDAAIHSISFEQAKGLVERGLEYVVVASNLSPHPSLTVIRDRVEAASPGFLDRVLSRLPYYPVAMVKVAPFTIKKLWDIQTKFVNSPQWATQAPGETRAEVVVQNGIVVSVDGQPANNGGQRPLTAGQLSMDWYDPGMPYSSYGYTFHGLELPHKLEVTGSDGGTPPEVVF